MTPLLELSHVSYAYHSKSGETHALSDLSFQAMEGEFLAVIGPSGCGKSTLLSLISGLLLPDAGTILLDGSDLESRKKEIGYMLQKDLLFEWRTVYQNVALGLEIQKRKTKESLETIEKMLKTYGLWQFRNARPSELSGGMRQRAALIRTLVFKSKAAPPGRTLLRPGLPDPPFCLRRRGGHPPGGEKNRAAGHP